MMSQSDSLRPQHHRVHYDPAGLGRRNSWRHKARRHGLRRPAVLNTALLLAATVSLLSLGSVCLGGSGDLELTWLKSVTERDTLTDNWLGLGERLAEEGVTVSLGLTQIYQINLDGGLATHRHAGRYTGSYDLEGEFNLQEMIGLSGAVVFVHAEGSWSAGLDDSSIGSVLGGVNDSAGGDRSIDLTELWYQQSLFDGRLRFRIGKIDLTGGFECRGCPVAFDGNAFANDEAGQFLNAALVNNPTIPFPDKGLGLALYAEPLTWWYVAAAVGDAQADAREMGFNTAFHQEDYFFSIFETGFTPALPSHNGPLQGAYRVGFWYDPQDKGRHSGSVKRDDMGIYLSFDQMAIRENADEDDSQGLGLFARWGWADKSVFEVRCFWSAGAQYQGLIPTRDDDVLGFGAAQGRLVRDAGFTTDSETVMELYYGAQITPWLSLAPSIQYILNPGGDENVDDAVVIGIRMQMSF